MLIRGTDDDTLTMLRKLASGEETLPAWIVAELAIPLVEAGLENREVTELERLFRLGDTRQ